MSSLPFRTGLENCLAEPPVSLRNARFGLLMNQASVDGKLSYACDALAARFPGQLAAIFSPQHGLWGEEQDNMIESPHGIYRPLGVPLHSLYSETRRPTPEMLAGLDALLIDLQDVGTRVYTYAWTVVHCLEACAMAGVPVVIADRPNPLGGVVVEGPLLDRDYTSFVGRLPIPLRHGLTIGELALLANRELSIGAALEVVRMSAWRRSTLWPELGRVWLPPSPNLPRWEAAFVYPGQVLLEGTDLSEGRGTTTPFEVCGAPYLRADELLARLPDPTAGATLMPVRFRPTFNKWRDQSCQGLAIRVTDARSVRSVSLTLQILWHVSQAHQEFQLLPPPYEYETEKMPIDILFGNDRLRAAFDGEEADLDPLTALDEAAWWEHVQDVLLYGEETATT